MVTNLDHVAWISPTMALELGRRAGVRLEAYHLAKPYAGPTARCTGSCGDSLRRSTRSRSSSTSSAAPRIYSNRADASR
jgi:hypothetical protein